MKKKLIALMMVAIMLLSLIPVSMASDTCVHNFQWVTKNATCTANGARQFKCTKCGVVATTQTINALGHDWNPATCTSARKCKRCGITSGGPLGHSLTAATCTSPKKCLRCGQTFGTIPQHRWEPATCTAAKKCKGCMMCRCGNFL